MSCPLDPASQFWTRESFLAACVMCAVPGVATPKFALPNDSFIGTCRNSLPLIGQGKSINFPSLVIDQLCKVLSIRLN